MRLIHIGGVVDSAVTVFNSLASFFRVAGIADRQRQHSSQLAGRQFIRKPQNRSGTVGGRLKIGHEQRLPSEFAELERTGGRDTGN